MSAAVLSSPPQPAAGLPRRRRGGPLLAVLAAHGLLGGWLWHATARTVAAPPVPERLQMVWLLPPAAPEPPVLRPEPPAPAPKPPEPRPESRVVDRDAPPPPITLPPAVDMPAPVAPPSDPAPAAPPAPETVAMAAAPAAPPPEPKVLPASAVRYLRAPSPTYPMLSLRQQEAGVVLVRILVDEEGQPRDVRLEQSSGYKRLDQAALDAAQRARFAPYIEQGVARAVWVVAPIHFALDRHS
ncbi:MAG TPA: energy transducer TonB [Methylibium sp.]|nr:energy transducer TonB [Methylibium sp.]